MKQLPFTSPLMEILAKELQEKAANDFVIHCYPNDLSRFYMILQGSERQEALFFCFAHPFVRFHLTSISGLPKANSFHPLNAFLQNGKLLNARILQNDRILELTFQTAQGNRLFIGEFFSKHPNYYLLKPDGTLLFSLHPLSGTHYQLPPVHPFSSPSPIWKSHKEVEQAYAKLEQEWEFTRQKEALQKELKGQLKKLQHKEKELIKQLNACSRWEAIQHEGELLKANFSLLKKGLSSLSVDDWLTGQPAVLSLDHRKTPHDEMALRFRKAKKLHDGIDPLKRFLNRIQEDIKRVEQKSQQIDRLTTAQELGSYKRSSPDTSSVSREMKPPKPSISVIYREYLSASGVKIWVGKNAKANDRLTLQLANGRDWWLHATGCPGSHVVIRLGKDEEPDSETLKDAMQLALHYSKARSQGEAEVCYTQRKFVSKMGRGKPGQVQISKHQTAWIKFDPIRFQALQDRMKDKT